MNKSFVRRITKNKDGKEVVVLAKVASTVNIYPPLEPVVTLHEIVAPKIVEMVQTKENLGG